LSLRFLYRTQPTKTKLYLQEYLHQSPVAMQGFWIDGESRGVESGEGFAFLYHSDQTSTRTCLIAMAPYFDQVSN